ncbi:3'-5' exonuclease [Linum grandiflorum]
MNPSIAIVSQDYHNPHLQRRFTLHFFDNPTIRTTVTSTPSVVHQWISQSLYITRYVSHKLVVGLGVQWRAPYDTSASTLQLCVGSRCLIYQFRRAGYIPQILARFLADPNITFVGVRNYSDERMLRGHGLQVGTLVDLCDIAARTRGLRGNLTMEFLANRVLGYEGVRKPPYVGMSNWNAYWLSDEQVQYACVDAVVSLKLGVEMEAWRLLF